VFSQDESRFGLLTVRRRRLTAYGVQPVGVVPHVFEWFYVYGAVEPTTGERFFLELPYLNAESFQLFVNAFAEAFPDSLNLLLLDNSGAHTAQRLTLPVNVRLVFLPPYCPELNPIERVWRDLKEALAWLQFPPSGCATRLSHDAPPGVSGRHAPIAHGLPLSRRGRSCTMSIMKSYHMFPSVGPTRTA
jgi:transposase